MKKITSLLIFILILCHSAFSQAQTPSPSPTRNPTTTTTPSHNNTPAPPEDYETMNPPEPDNFVSQLTSMITTLGILIGLILIFTWILKRLLSSRMQQINVKSSIKIIETRHISTKASIHLLDVLGTGLVISESHNGITKLMEFPIDNSTSDFGKLMETKDSIDPSPNVK